MKDKNVCCICGCEIEGYGNNPHPISSPDNRCCNNCDRLFVIPARCGNSILYTAAVELMSMNQAGYLLPPIEQTARMAESEIEVKV